MSERKEAYQEYLKSKEWAARRKWALERAENRCQVCNSDGPLDVHHRTYERLGNEWPSDLTVLCRECHELFHERMASVDEAPDPPKRRKGVARGAEVQLLKLMSRGPEWVERARLAVGEGDFEDPRHHLLFAAFVDDPELRPSAIKDPGIRKRYEEILSDPEDLGPRVFTDAVNRVRVSSLVRRIEKVQGAIETATDDGEKIMLMKKKASLAEELRKLYPGYWRAGI